MKFLFVHQNYPGQFLHILKLLADQDRHEIVFIGEPSSNRINGVRKIPYQCPSFKDSEIHPAARDFDSAVRRAESVAKTATGLKQLGFDPDIIIGHHGWGEMLNLRDVWPKIPMLGYMEFYYRHDHADVGFDPEFPVHPLDYARIRAKNTVNHAALSLGGIGQCPTQWQLSTYPEWAQSAIELVWEGVDLDVCCPDPGITQKPFTIDKLTILPSDRLVTYVSRNLEPYRGFHTFMRAIPGMLRDRRDLKIVLVGGDGVSYGPPPRTGETWRQFMLHEMGDKIDHDRIAFPSRLPYRMYLKLLQRSDAHIYLTYPFVASWSLREALAIGCPVIGSDTEPVREFISHGTNGLLTPFLNWQSLAENVLTLLGDYSLSARLRHNARSYAVRNLAMQDYFENYGNVIDGLTGENPVQMIDEQNARLSFS